MMPTTTVIASNNDRRSSSLSLWRMMNQRAEGNFYHSRPLVGATAATAPFVRNVVASWHYDNNHSYKLLDDPKIISPYQTAISSLDLEKEERFLLVGGEDATLSIFDLSKWGSDEEHQQQLYARQGHVPRINEQQRMSGAVTMQRHYKPIARSNRTTAPTESIHQRHLPPVPSGHASAIVRAQWYRVDPGACVSASIDGSLLVWDTQCLTPVIQWNPLSSGSCSCLDLSPNVGGRSESLLAVGSYQENLIKLVDLRSGASSHSLHGHVGGISAVLWASTTDVVLASGGLDGTIRLWDIRKSGSRSCLTILNREASSNSLGNSKPYTPTYEQLKRPHDISSSQPSGTTTNNSKNVRLQQGIVHPGKRRKTLEVAPNNYGSVETSGVVSHGGPISSLAFCPDGHGLVSTGRDGMMQIWDLRGLGHAVPIRFFRPSSINAQQQHQHQQQPLMVNRKAKRICLSVVPQTATCTRIWLGHGSQTVAYSMERGGMPLHVLEGHLGNVSALEPCRSTFRLLTAGRDGMILSWGKTANNNYTPTTYRRNGRRTLVDDRDSW